jgi:hypothetical protein
MDMGSSACVWIQEIIKAFVQFNEYILTTVFEFAMYSLELEIKLKK